MNKSRDIKQEVSNDMLEPLNVDSEPEVDNMKNFYYKRPIEYWLILLGYAIGYGSFWRFPYLIYSCGGGVFFIPFLLFLFLVGVPMFMLEAMLGQMFKKGPVEVFDMVKKRFAGVGWGGVVISWVTSLYYAIILCWSVFYFFQSFISPLPWSQEAYAENNPDLSTNTTAASTEDYINFDYFKNEVIKMSAGIHDMGSINPSTFLCLIVTYVLIFICIFKGVESTSTVVYVTGPAPVVLMIILLIKALTLPGISIGLKYLFLPNLEKLFDIEVWIKASNQVIFMLALGFGGNIILASYRREHEDIYLSSFWIPTITFFFGLLCAFINFAFLGHFSYLVNIPIEQLPLSGVDLAFITYPSALCTLSFSNFWSILFFLMLMTLGIDSQFTYNEMVSHYLYEAYMYKYFTRTNCSVIICVVGFICGLPFITNGGIYLFELVDRYASLISGFTISFFEAYIVTKYIDLDVMQEIVANKTKKIIPGYVLFSIKYISPVVHGLLILFSFTKALGELVEYSVLWPYILQWIVIFAPIFPIIWCMYKYRNDDAVNNNPPQGIIEMQDKNETGYENEIENENDNPLSKTMNL